MDSRTGKMVAHHDWWSGTYDDDYFGKLSLYHQVSLDNVRRFVPEKEGSLVLDAGGGTGIWSVELARMGYRVVLTDISEGMLGKAREKIDSLGFADQIEVRVADICDLSGFPDSHFHMVVCQGDPLSYCSDRFRAMAELARVVQPGGAVIASVDNRASALKWLDETEDRQAVTRLLKTGQVVMPVPKKELSYTVHAYTAEELRELFESNGLAVERIIGKLVFRDRLPWFKANDPSLLQWLLELELEHNDDPAFFPRAGHLEIAGRKRFENEK